MRDLLEPLSPYAMRPPSEAPPEILPSDPHHDWNLKNTACRVLGYLMAKMPVDENLLELADYLLTFTTLGRDGLSDTMLLNGTALALCGYVAEGQHKAASLWRMVGSARVASCAHMRKAAVDDMILVDCLRVVTRVADELNLPVLADLITLNERMFGAGLNHDRAERLHVSEVAYPSFMSDPVPIEEVGTLLRNRPWMKDAIALELLDSPDMKEADLLLKNIVTLRAHMLVRHQFGSDIDWHLRLFDDLESTVSLNHHQFLPNLAAAYRKTNDIAYAEKAAWLLRSFYYQTAIPNHWQQRNQLGPWRTLEVGTRQCNMWPVVLGLLGDSEPFTSQMHAMIGRSRLEHIHWLLAFCGHPNNWFQVESSGLAVAALFSPELELADAYLRVAMRRLLWINRFAYYDDGFQFELTHSYHVFPTRSMYTVVRAAKARGVQLPQMFTSLIEKAHEMYVFAVQPNHILPMFNDCNPNPVDPAPYLKAAADTFERDDFLWAATHGAEGTSPDPTSHAWESAGLYLMRDKWGEDAQYLHFDGAAWGASHQHEDKLNFVLYAEGRLLIGDPNIYSYSMTELTHYFRSSRAHNGVMIDGMGQARRVNPDARLVTEGQNEWVSEDEFDFVSSEYLEGFAPNPYTGERFNLDVEVDKRFAHRRAIFYAKPTESTPGYWILSDLITGESNEVHTLEQIFKIAPIYNLGSVQPIQAGKVTITPNRIITEDAGLGNLAILPLDRDHVDIRKQKGETNPARGWYGVQGEFPAWDVTLETKRRLPARMDAVLFPLAAEQTATPTVKRLYSDDIITAFSIKGAGIDDLFVLSEETDTEITLGKVMFEGRALLLRRSPTLQTLAVKAAVLQLDGQDVLS